MFTTFRESTTHKVQSTALEARGQVVPTEPLGLPALLAYAVIALEFFGGLALILGIYAPMVALPLALEMLGTIVFVHGANGWLFTNKGGGWEFPAFWTAGLIALYLLGDGAMALKPTQRSAS